MFTLKRVFPGLPETERGRPFVLKADPKNERLVYGIANSVIVRSLTEAGTSDLVTNHAKKVTNACFAPSGFYIASGDAGGAVKIWDTVGEEKNVKYEYPLMAGNVYDICWSEDSKRIAVAGVGREVFGCVVSWDTGTNVGTISRHSKTCLSIDFKQTRPYAIVTGSEDFAVNHHLGPPFKFNKKCETHTNFVNTVRFNKDGSMVASGGSDGKIIIYDGKTMDVLHELVAEGKKRAHEGSVYGVSWNPEGTKLLSASGDKTCKIWNVTDKVCEKTFDMGKNVTDQQLGCLWAGQHIISLSLSGQLNFLDPENPAKLKKYYWGHNKGIVSVGITKDKKFILTGSYEGHLNIWDVATGDCQKLEGPQFMSQVTSFSIFEDEIAAVGVGKVVKFGSVSQKKFHDQEFKAESEVLCVVMTDASTAVVGGLGYLYLMKDKAKADMITIPYDAISIAAYDGGKKVAVGGKDKKIHFYKIDGGKLVAESNEINYSADIASLSISHDMKTLIVCSATRYAHQYNLETLKEEVRWMAQANRVNCAVWSDDDKYIATTGVDGAIIILKPGDPDYRVENKLAHRMYNCTSVVWLNENTIASFGQQDCAIKFWEVKL